MTRSDLKLNGNRNRLIHGQSERVYTLASRWVKGLACVACILCSLGLLVACAPTTSTAGTGDPETTQNAAAAERDDAETLVRWTATVTGAERWSGTFRGEAGAAIVQDGELLELELSNRVYSGAARYGLGGPTVQSEPFMLTVQTQALSGPGGGAILKYGLADGGIPEDAYFAGPLGNLELSIGEGEVSGSAVFEMRNSPGETVTVAVEFSEIKIRE